MWEYNSTFDASVIYAFVVKSMNASVLSNFVLVLQVSTFMRGCVYLGTKDENTQNTLMTLTVESNK